MVSLNQIVSRINEVADEHYMLKTFQCGNLSQIAEIDSQEDLVYPLAYLDRRSASSTGGAFFFNFDLIITDLVKTDRSNEQEVISDCMQIAQDFAVLLERPEYLNISDTAWLNPTQTINYSIISEEYSDRVAGVVMSFQIKQAFTYNRCVTPVTGNSNCQSAPTCTDTINSLGADYYDCVLPSYDFTTSRVQNAVTAQQQTDLIAWLCVSGDDATVNVNGNLYDTVEAGGTLNVNVEYEDNTDVGTINGAVVEIPNNRYNRASQIKSGQTTSYRANDDGDLERGRETSFTALSSNNPFGNANRFTDDTGAQTYTSNWVIDWAFVDYVNETVIGWFRTEQGGGGVSWNTVMAGQPYTLGGYADCYIPNVNELNSIINYELNVTFNYSPFNLSPSVAYWTSTTAPSTTLNSKIGASSGIANIAKTSTVINYIVMRVFTFAELGL